VLDGVDWGMQRGRLAAVVCGVGGGKPAYCGDDLFEKAEKNEKGVGEKESTGDAERSRGLRTGRTRKVIQGGSDRGENRGRGDEYGPPRPHPGYLGGTKS